MAPPLTPVTKKEWKVLEQLQPPQRAVTARKMTMPRAKSPTVEEKFERNFQRAKRRQALLSRMKG